MFQPLEEVICEELIPAIVGRKISNLERKVFALPVRFGGLGIQDPSETADREYAASCKVTEELTKLILEQDMTLGHLNKFNVAKAKAELKKQREDAFKEEYENISNISTFLDSALRLSRRTENRIPAP